MGQGYHQHGEDGDPGGADQRGAGSPAAEERLRQQSAEEAADASHRDDDAQQDDAKVEFAREEEVQAADETEKEGSGGCAFEKRAEDGIAPRGGEAFGDFAADVG